MKNKAHEFTAMTEEERSMHLFYTIEGMVESLQLIGNQLNTEKLNGSSRLAKLADLSDEIESLYERVNRDYIFDKTQNAIAYSI
jgi:hypothetical protein